jgi:hypothetical protein
MRPTLQHGRTYGGPPYHTTARMERRTNGNSFEQSSGWMLTNAWRDACVRWVMRSGTLPQLVRRRAMLHFRHSWQHEQQRSSNHDFLLPYVDDLMLMLKLENCQEKSTSIQQ